MLVAVKPCIRNNKLKTSSKPPLMPKLIIPPMQNN